MTLIELATAIKDLQGTDDTEQYRVEWSLEDTPWAFDENIEQRVESMIANYAQFNGLDAWEVSIQVSELI